jgi:hypothetical protein
VATVVALLRARPEVKSVLDYANTGDPTMISKATGPHRGGGHRRRRAGEAGRHRPPEHAIAAQPSLKGNTWLGGPTVADVQIAAVSSQDLGRAELYALPFLILLLFFVFRGLRAAAVPLVGAVFAIAVTLGVMGLVMVVLPLSVFALNLVIALGIGLSVDFSLLIVSRFREEFRRQGSIDAALVTVRRPRDTPCCSALSPSPRPWPPWPSSPSASSTPWGSPAPSSSGRRRLRPTRPAVDPDRLRERIAVRTPLGDHPASEATADANDGTLVPDRHPGHAPARHLGALRRVGAGGPGLTVPARLVHRGRRQRAAGQQLRRHGLQAGPDQVPAFSEAPAGVVVDAAQATPAELASTRPRRLHVPGVKAVSTFEHLGARCGSPTWPCPQHPCRRPPSEP